MSRRLIISGGSRPRELVLVDTLVVGRDPACDISETNDPLLSRRHAAFTAGPVAPVDWTSVGRNDSCPCGSGKKFKKCHGRSM